MKETILGKESENKRSVSKSQQKKKKYPKNTTNYTQKTSVVELISYENVARLR